MASTVLVRGSLLASVRAGGVYWLRVLLVRAVERRISAMEGSFRPLLEGTQSSYGCVAVARTERRLEPPCVSGNEGVGSRWS